MGMMGIVGRLLLSVICTLSSFIFFELSSFFLHDAEKSGYRRTQFEIFFVPLRGEVAQK